MIYLPFGSAVRNLSTLHDYIQGDQVGSEGAQTGSLKNTSFNLSRQILLAIWRGPGPLPRRMPGHDFRISFVFWPIILSSARLLDYFILSVPLSSALRHGGRVSFPLPSIMDTGHFYRGAATLEISRLERNMAI
jgi:hypothetical protein